METGPDLKEVIEMFEKPIVNYVMDFMVRVGMPVDREGAENIVCNVGSNIRVRKQERDLTLN